MMKRPIPTSNGNNEKGSRLLSNEGNQNLGMITPTVTVATWSDGLFVIVGENRHHELAGQSGKALSPDRCGGCLAITDEHSLCRRTSDGRWITSVTCEFEFACVVAVGDAFYVGTDDARVLRVFANGQTEQLSGFDAVEGRAVCLLSTISTSQCDS